MFTNYLIINDKINICIKSNNADIFNQLKLYMENFLFAEHSTKKSSLTFFIIKNENLLNKCIKIKNKSKKSNVKEQFFLKIRNNNAIIVDKSKKQVYFLYKTFSLSKLEYILKFLISLVNILNPINNAFYLKATCVSKDGKRYSNFM